MNWFNVIVPVYNAERWIGKCIDSILMQDYAYYDLLVIDDHSTDCTWDIIRSYNISSIRNKERRGALANIVRGIECIGKDIIVTIDGDDWLADGNVLSYLSSVYNKDVWLTYGSFIPLSQRYSGTCQPFDNLRYVKKDGNYDYTSLTSDQYRKSGLWVTSHLRTFRKQLWDKIDREDLKDNGEFYKVAWDYAFMYPMIEMASERVKFIEIILYIYNDLNPMCDGTVDPELQVETGRKIQEKKEYARLDGDIL